MGAGVSRGFSSRLRCPVALSCRILSWRTAPRSIGTHGRGRQRTGQRATYHRRSASSFVLSSRDRRKTGSTCSRHVRLQRGPQERDALSGKAPTARSAPHAAFTRRLRHRADGGSCGSWDGPALTATPRSRDAVIVYACEANRVALSAGLRDNRPLDGKTGRGGRDSR